MRFAGQKWPFVLRDMEMDIGAVWVSRSLLMEHAPYSIQAGYQAK